MTPVNPNSGLVSHVQRYSLHDGPGIRTTVFLKGCPLRCAWCHNPENLAPRPEVLVFESRCVRCGACASVCPQPGENRASECRHCGACVAVCPTGAREIVGRSMTVGEVMDEIEADRVFYDESGGGVTFSGGEPLMQHGFLRTMLETCRSRGVHTAVDTCGYAPWEVLEALAPWTDLFLYDLKLMDDARHREFTGVSNAVILENLEALDRARARLWLRIPVIPGINDTPVEIAAMAQFARALNQVSQIHLLPYHRTGIHKFERLGRPYRLEKVGVPPAERLEWARQQFAALGLDVRTGG
jgi:pyruvate formate lyase activating enzyme